MGWRKVNLWFLSSQLHLRWHTESFTALLAVSFLQDHLIVPFIPCHTSDKIFLMILYILHWSSLFIIMRANLITLAIGFAFTGISAALNTEEAGFYSYLSKRTLSPDNTYGDVYAGANKSYSCDATSDNGGCCSQYGYCGNTTGMLSEYISMFISDEVEL
jgi:hypothetical protein